LFDLIDGSADSGGAVGTNLAQTSTKGLGAIHRLLSVFIVAEQKKTLQRYIGAYQGS